MMDGSRIKARWAVSGEGKGKGRRSRLPFEAKLRREMGVLVVHVIGFDGEGVIGSLLMLEMVLLGIGRDELVVALRES